MRRLRMGMIGGGPGAFIGPVHRFAAELDREIELVAGVFSSNADRSSSAAAQYLIDPARAYGSLDEMFAAEKAREDGIDFVSIVTPNHNHLPSARAALAAGLPVMTDKPLTATLAEAQELSGTVAKAGLPFGVTFTYTGYPLVREMRERIAAGAIGTLRKVVVEYPQGWLSQPAEGKQAEWRVDPAQAGAGGCIGDIGVHAFNLAEFVTGEKVTRLLGDLDAVVPGRTLDDDCTVLLRFANGARGVLLASQIEVGELNGTRIRVYGDKAGMRWQQDDANRLEILHADGRIETIQTGTDAVGPLAAARTRTPGGHPEGYLEAFANIYRDFAATLRGEDAPCLPGIAEGLRGMAFIDTAVRASANEAGWVDLTV
ncbi:Gfo/Idh/MocA family protein [Altererythrobacter sp. B11]|uniref:Gfo/Idh/MocA family protein n=1 Tax=Altererythrobacter sp. B11 TaxID=2060312 RepID=UPI000E5AA83F|nr:Gfo/Idh/MocA family oxidoreductase [Altererythrobacter sp. B11]